jgi:glycosyltransferase involved in cell wall biosynthesis
MKDKLKILVITSWEYNDALIQSHTLPYLKIINELFPKFELILSTEEKRAGFFDAQNLTAVHSDLLQYNITLMPHPYRRFGLRKLIAAAGQFLKLWYFIVSKKVDYIQGFCTPAGGLGYLLSVSTGRKLLLDSYEPHAESMVENGAWNKDGIAYKILWWLEKKQTQRAKKFIAIASGMDQYALQKYGVSIPEVHVKPCCVNLEKFKFEPAAYDSIRSELGFENKIVLVYAGKFGGIYLDDEVFNFFKVAYQFWGDRFRILLLTALSKDNIFQHCAKSGVPSSIFHIAKVPFDQMPRYLSAADFGITPVKPVPSKRYCSPIKDGEYWAMGLPVVITKNISDDSEIIATHNIGAVLESLETLSYQKAVEKIDELLREDRTALRKRIRDVAVRFRNYDIARDIYQKIYTDSSFTRNK